MSDTKTLEVRNQYESFPYPPVDPQEEHKELKVTFTDHPARVNHYGWSGRHRFGKGFRILIAGGGTGNSTIGLAECFGSRGAEIVYLDLSSQSMAIAKERADIRKIDIIKFIRASLLDLPNLDVGMFDYIECSGVLHHLPDPAAGLAALVSVLKEDGVMNLMVYGQIGRTAVYQMQQLLRSALRGISDPDEKISIGREIIHQLPATSWFRHLWVRFQGEVANDAGFYDLLLHSQDRAYTVPQIYEWLENAGLQLNSFTDYYTSGEIRYHPAYYLSHLSKPVFDDMPRREREALAEIVVGDIVMHNFYASRKPAPLPDPEDANYVPVWGAPAQRLPKGELGRMAASTNDSELVFQLQGSPCVVTMKRGVSTAALLSAIDEVTTSGTLIANVAAAKKLPVESVRQDYLTLYRDLNRHDLLLLKHKDVPPYSHLHDLQEAMLRRRASGQTLSETRVVL